MMLKAASARVIDVSTNLNPKEDVVACVSMNGKAPSLAEYFAALRKHVGAAENIPATKLATYIPVVVLVTLESQVPD